MNCCAFLRLGFGTASGIQMIRGDALFKGLFSDQQLMIMNLYLPTSHLPINPDVDAAAHGGSHE